MGDVVVEDGCACGNSVSGRTCAISTDSAVRFTNELFHTGDKTLRNTALHPSTHS